MGLSFILVGQDWLFEYVPKQVRGLDPFLLGLLGLQVSHWTDIGGGCCPWMRGVVLPVHRSAGPRTGELLQETRHLRRRHHRYRSSNGFRYRNGAVRVVGGRLSRPTRLAAGLADWRNFSPR